MRWVDGISILSILLSGSTLIAISSGAGADNRKMLSSVIAVDGAGRGGLLDSLVPGGEPALVVIPAEPAIDMAASTPSESAEPTGASSVPCVNINTADEKQLVSLKGIGPALAANIVAYRDLKGSFSRKEDLQKVKGIGPAKYAQIVGHICL